jgi:hypothetical protein
MTKTSSVTGAVWTSSGITVQFNMNCSYYSFRNKLMHCKPISLTTDENYFVYGLVFQATQSTEVDGVRQRVAVDSNWLYVEGSQRKMKKFHNEELNFSKS